MSIPIVLLVVVWLVFALLSLMPVLSQHTSTVDSPDGQQAAWMARWRVAGRAGLAICAMLALIAFFEVEFPEAKAPAAEPPSWWQSLGAGLLAGWVFLTICLWRAIPVGALLLLLAMLFAFADPFVEFFQPVSPIEQCRRTCAARFGTSDKLTDSRRSCIDQCFHRTRRSAAAPADPAH